MDQPVVIPKTIHQIWYQGQSQIPSKYRAFMKTWTDQQDLRYEFWDEKRILNVVPKEWMDILSVGKLIEKIDFAKYVILYLFGGVYVDMDLFAIQEISPFLQQNSSKDLIVFTHNTPKITIVVNNLLGLHGRMIINNAIIFCTKGNPKMLNIISACIASSKKNHLLISNQLRCLVTTGPIMFTNEIRKMKGWKDFTMSQDIFEPYTTLELTKLCADVGKWSHDGLVDEKEYENLMYFLANHKPIPNTFGIHVLDLNWFKNGKNNWKFVIFKKICYTPRALRK